MMRKEPSLSTQEKLGCNLKTSFLRQYAVTLKGDILM